MQFPDLFHIRLKLTNSIVKDYLQSNSVRVEVRHEDRAVLRAKILSVLSKRSIGYDLRVRLRINHRRQAIKTQGEIEAAVCDGMSKFEHDFMGRGPKDIRAHLIGDLLVVRLQGVLTAAEQHLVMTLPPEKGRDLLKQVRTQLIEIARPALETLIGDATGCKPISMHHDISTISGEEVVIFSLAESPVFRPSTSKAR